MTPKGQIIRGYKATDKDMCCRGFKFELGKWYEHDGDLALCESGFHFCEYSSGPWSYYDDGRLFTCEAEFVILTTGPGADLKHVCKKIRLTAEIKVTGYRNTGDGNAGYGNQGDNHSGCLNYGNAKFYIFNKLADRSNINFDLAYQLSRLLMSDDDFDTSPFLKLQNASDKAIKNLHKAHIAARKGIK